MHIFKWVESSSRFSLSKYSFTIGLKRDARRETGEAHDTSDEASDEESDDESDDASVDPMALDDEHEDDEVTDKVGEVERLRTCAKQADVEVELSAWSALIALSVKSALSALLSALSA